MGNFNENYLAGVVDGVRELLSEKGISFDESEYYVDVDANDKDLFCVIITANNRTVEARANHSKDMWTIQGIGDGFSSFKQWHEQGWVYAEFSRCEDIVEIIYKYLTEVGAYTR